MAIGDYEPPSTGFSKVTPQMVGGIQPKLKSGYVAGNDFFGEETLGPIGTKNGQTSSAPRSGGTILEFPMNVASGDAALGNHGHYIMFYINEQDKAQLSMSDRATGGSIADNLAEPYNIPSFVREYDAKSKSYQSQRNPKLDKKNVNDNIPENQTIDEMRLGRGRTAQQDTQEKTLNVQQNLVGQQKVASGSTVRVKRKPTKRLKTSIAMYMPQSVQVTYGAQYQDTQIGAISEEALNVYNSLVEGRAGARAELKQAGKNVADSLQQFLLTSVGVIPGLGGLRETAEMKTGNVIADRLELAFKGINKRNFQYTFKMTPKDRKEVEMIRKIIFAFKSNMMPEFVGGNRGGRRLLVPNTFDIAYMYTGNQNLHLHNISTCVLENMTVSYGGDRYRTFEADAEGAQPVETTITLAFKEMELITRERIFEGY